MDEYGLSAEDTGALAILAGLGIVMAVVALVVWLFIGYCLGKLFEKAGKPMWAGFVPIYNMVVILQIVGRPVWWIALFLVALIPIVGPIAAIALSAVIWIDFAKSYGKDMVWGLLLTFFSIVMLPIMAFSSDTRYVGPSVSSGS